MKPKARVFALIGLAAGEGRRPVICTVMEAGKGGLYHLLWQGLLSCCWTENRHVQGCNRGLFRFPSVCLVSFGLIETPKLGVSIYKRDNLNKRFVSDSVGTSFCSSFGCFESKIVSRTPYFWLFQMLVCSIRTFTKNTAATQKLNSHNQF